MYEPHNWVLLKINSPTPHYKVLAGWRGGYLDGDSWRMNSGVVRHDEDEEKYYFYGYSGSCYVCHKNREGLSNMATSVYNGLKEKHGDKVSCLIVEQDGLPTDWLLGEETH